jgi:exopolysaccharide biosynthesis polyprenyl glycosylphosphotransferase
MNSPELPIDLPDQPHSRIHWYGEMGFADKAVMTDSGVLAGWFGGILDLRSPKVPERLRISPPAKKTANMPVVEIPTRQGAATTKLHRHVPAGGARSSRNGSLDVNDILPERQFLRLLRLEKRRAERSKAPLSIVLFRFDSEYGDELSEVRGLLDVIHSSKRETDRLGYLEIDLIALLLPDTSEQGAKAFTESINNRLRALHFSATCVTYPDQLFQYVLARHLDPASSYPLFLADPEPRQLGDLVKRALDIVGSLVAITLFSPLMLIVAATIKMTSPGPIVFRQARLGYGGAPFVFYKFRSMSANADDRIHREYVASLIRGNHAAVNQGDAANPLYKIKSDPRVTRIGRIIRKTSMDELPQLFNVLKGNMSLVGPRPPIPYEAEKYEPWHLRRILEIKPGITGLWQVEGRSKTSFDDMVRLDLRYVRYCSLILDVKILLKTLIVVFKREGAT